MEKIILWDIDATRLMRLQSSLTRALKSAHIRAQIECNSEAPLLSRMQLIEQVPLIEINGNFWSYEKNQEISYEQCVELLKIIFK